MHENDICDNRNFWKVVKPLLSDKITSNEKKQKQKQKKKKKSSYGKNYSLTLSKMLIFYNIIKQIRFL